jgi:starch synthase
MPLRVAFLSAEAVPFAKVGGLADVAGALPRELGRLGARVHLVIPAYRDIDRARWGIRRVNVGNVPPVEVGMDSLPWWLEVGALPDSNVEVWLIGGPPFERPGIYADPHTGRPFEDELVRWVFFSRAALLALRLRLDGLDVLHLNDHHTALAAAYARRADQPRAADAGATFFSIHNLGYQGLYERRQFDLLGLPESFVEPYGPLEFWGRLNVMKMAIVLADLVGTVSPTYAREIQASEEQGRGLEGVLRTRQEDLVGILNGIDVETWDPARDPYIAAPFDAGDPSGKAACKRALLSQLGLQYDAAVPLFGSVGRLVSQKGFDLLLAALPELLPLGMQCVILGTGEPRIETALLELARQFPGQFAVTRSFDDALAHQIEAGADFFLMPSRYEPCGLNQMYSLRYGTVPIVRRTGGLADTVHDWDPHTGAGNGFAFDAYTPAALATAVRRALAAFRHAGTMQRLRCTGMAADFSWRLSAQRYLDAYQTAGARHRERAAAGIGTVAEGIDRRPGIGTIRRVRERE